MLNGVKKHKELIKGRFFSAIIGSIQKYKVVNKQEEQFLLQENTIKTLNNSMLDRELGKFLINLILRSNISSQEY